MAKITVKERLDARLAWNKLCPPLTHTVFEKFTGLSYWAPAGHIGDDTFVPDECKNRIDLLQSEHAYSLIQAWMAQQEPE